MHDGPRRRPRTLARTLPFILLALASVAGCRGGLGGGGRLTAESLGPGRAALDVPVTCAVHRSPDAVTTFAVLTDQDEDAIVADTWTDGQVLEVEVLWRPRAGATPMDATATNVRLRHVVRAQGRTGVYEGAGFAMPGSDPGADRLKLDLRDSTLRLTHADPGFRDLLTPARITGGIGARRDDDATGRLERAIDRLVADVPRVADPGRTDD